VCFDESTNDVWTDKSKFMGVCVGRVCDESLKGTANAQCHFSQRCVRKVLGIDQSGGVRGSAKGRCLNKSCTVETGLWQCADGWSCIQDVRNVNGNGFCSPNGFTW
jgi:hypothetical protein